MSASDLTTPRVGGEDEPIRKRLEPREFTDREGPSFTVVVNGVALRVQGPRPNVRV